LALLAASSVSTPSKADDDMRSSPPDTNSYSRPVIAEDLDPLSTAGTADAARTVQFNAFVVDAVVNNTDPDLKTTDTFNDGEVSIAVKRQHPDQLVMTAFSGSWGLNAPLWRSRNRGKTWTKEFTIDRPPAVAGIAGCPCDQTIDFTQSKGLAGAFLTSSPTNIYTARNGHPAAINFVYFESHRGVAQKTNHLDGLNKEDQPWLLVGPQPGASGENIYVAYDDFHTAPDMHVAVAGAASPGLIGFTVDNISGFSTGFVNPGHRLAIDPSSGAVYSLFQRRIAAGCALKAHETMSPEMATAVKPSRQPRTESCVASGNGLCEA
jgi:hypothetical protein